jgi:hypothetical protein
VDFDFQHTELLAEVPYTLGEILGRELEPKETVAWLGQPNVARFVIRRLGTVVFGIPFFAFAVFWTLTATSGFAARGPVANSSEQRSIVILEPTRVYLVSCGEINL